MPSFGSLPASAEPAVPGPLGVAVALTVLLTLTCGPLRTRAEEPAVAPAPSTRHEGVVDLPGDGFLLGRLLDRSAAESLPATGLLWESPLSEQPFEFSATGFRRIRFPRREPAAAPPEAWRVDLADGGFAIGSLTAVDPDRVVLDVPGVGRGPLRIRRTAITRLSRGPAAGRVAVPGTATPEWSLAESARQEWDGRIVCTPPGGAAYRDVAAPRRACFDVWLSWQERPDLEILFAVGTSPPNRRRILTGNRTGEADEYRIETIAGDLLAVREAEAARLDDVVRLPAGPGRLHLLAFVDQETGRLAVAIPEGDGPVRPVFDEAVPPRTPTDASGSGFGIRLLKGDVRIDALQARPWVESEPRLPEPVGPAGPGSELVSFDAVAATFTVRDEGGLRQLAAAAISEIAFRTGTPPESSTPGTMVAAFNGDARLSGSIAAVQPDSIRLECPALEEPLECPPGQLAALEVAGVRRAGDLPGRRAVLEAEQGRMAGCLVNGGSGLAWLPDGGTRPVPLAAVNGPFRIVYGSGGRNAAGLAGAAAAPTPARPAAAEATIFLKTGDSFLGTVLAGGPEGLRIRTGNNEAVVAAVALRAVELQAADSAAIPRTIFDRLLTLPRMQQSDPPTHMLRLLRGDYLRGKLVAIDDRVVRFSVLGTVKEIPRADVARLIWLSVEGDDSLEQAVAALAGGRERDGVPLRATFNDGRFLTLRAERLEGEVVIGRNGLLPTARVDLAQCLHLDRGFESQGQAAGSLPYARWVLKPAALPRPLREDAANGSPPARDPSKDPPAGIARAAEGHGDDAPASAAELQAFEQAREQAVARDRRCLETLGRLLDAESELVRRRTSGLLRRLTGLTPAEIPFRADADAASREEDVRRWRRWLAVQGISAVLAFPQQLEAWPDARPIIGRTLVCRSGGVQELDEQGDIVFEVAVESPWACDVTAEGHRLIGDHGGRAVVEYDERGREVWAVRNLPGGPMSVRRLDNGNTLVALSDADQVAEYDPQGRVAWSVRITGRPCDARRLPDGNTLVAAHRGNRLVEVDARGNEQWAVEGIDDPQTAQRLPNGNTLVAMSVPGIVREIDPVGRTVWQQEGFRIAVDAQRLPDGRTLVQEQGGDLVELDPDGTETGRLPTAGSRFLRW